MIVDIGVVLILIFWFNDVVWDKLLYALLRARRASSSTGARYGGRHLAAYIRYTATDMSASKAWSLPTMNAQRQLQMLFLYIFRF